MNELPFKIDGFVTTKNLMDKYGITKQAVHEWRKLGLPYAKLDGRTLIYNEWEVHQWLLDNMNNRKNRGVIK